MYRSSLALFTVILAVGCQPLPEIDVTLGPSDPGTDDALFVQVDVVGEASDLDAVRPSYSYTFEWLRNGELSEAPGSDFLLSEWTLRDDEWQVRVTPTWGNRSGTPVTSDALTIVNAPPRIDSITMDPTEPGSHEDITAIVGSTDPDGEVPTLTYQWLKNGVPTTNEGPVLSASLTTMNDEWEVRVTPTDAYEPQLQGAEMSASVAIGNGAPIVESVAIWVQETPSKETVQAGDTLETEAVVFDAEGDVISVSYTWLVNDIGQNTTSWTTLDSGYFKKGDTVRVEAVPSDLDLVGIAVLSDPIVVANTAPSIQVAQLSPAVIREETVVSCEGLGFQDVDGDVPQNIFSWTADGVDIGVATDTLTGENFQKGQKLRCCVEPFDGEDAGSPRCSEERVVLNSPPVLTSSSISPSAPTKADVLSVNISAGTDPDGDPVSESVVWYLDGSPASTDPSLDLSDVNFEKGQAIKAVVRPFDGTDLGTEVHTAEVVIQNALPVVHSITMTPSTVYTDDVLTPTVDVSDLDGDLVTLEYGWTVNGSSVSTLTTLDGGIFFDRGDVIGLEVTPSDTEAGAAVSAASLTVQNSAPEGLVAGIDPEKPVAAVDDLQCKVDTAATDADGDAVTYTVSWTQNGSAFTGASTTTWTGDTVAAGDTQGGDDWTCVMTPADSTDSGTTATVSVEISYPWEMIAGGGRHSCGLDTNGDVLCWGDDADNQSSPPSYVYDHVATGGFHSCGITSGLITCWGRDTDDQVSDAPTSGSYADVALGLKHSCARNTSGNLSCWGRDLSGCTTPPSGSYATMSVGEYHGCAVDYSGDVSCWGRDVDGEASPPVGTFSMVAAGASHTCGILDSSGGLDCWGSNTSGATSAPATTGYTSLACGKYHCCAVSSTGGIDCWGDDTWSQSTPPTTGTWEGVTAGRYHTCAWTASGFGTCWGQNSFLQSTIP